MEEFRHHGNNITIRYIAHPSDSDPKADVKETADAVTITLTVRSGCRNCTDEGATRTITVSLDEPLGSRTMEDGSQG